jgi:hypothetical protein
MILRGLVFVIILNKYENKSFKFLWIQFKVIHKLSTIYLATVNKRIAILMKQNLRLVQFNSGKFDNEF